jgi:pimeloyl-ACP methyl ester carboxylesterase
MGTAHEKRYLQIFLMTIERNFFTSDNVSMRYIMLGDSEPVLFLPGAGVSASVYIKILQKLAEHHRVIAPDLPCFGESSVPKDVWGLDDYAKFIGDFLDSLSIDRATIVGHSLGGGVALALTSKNRASSLIIADSAGLAPAYTLAKLKYKFYIEKTYDNFKHKKGINCMSCAYQDFLKNRTRKALEWKQVEKIVQKCIYEGFNDWKNIKCPVLILWGDKDKIFPVEYASKFQQNLPTSQLQIIEGTHDWPIYKPEEFFSLISKAIQ